MAHDDDARFNPQLVDALATFFTPPDSLDFAALTLEANKQIEKATEAAKARLQDELARARCPPVFRIKAAAPMLVMVEDVQVGTGGTGGTGGSVVKSDDAVPFTMDGLIVSTAVERISEDVAHCWNVG